MTDEQCGYDTPTGPCKNPPTDGDHCWIDSHTSNRGRPTKWSDERREQLLEAARSGMTIEGCARAAGIGVSTLYEWLDNFPEFSEAFNRARGEGERQLVDEVVREDPKFILERSFGYTKSQEIEHSGAGGGPIEITFSEEVVKTPWESDE